jgi:serine/threonine protein kinase
VKTALTYSDLKPDNILLDERGHAHITDFNIAVHFSERRLLTGVAGSMAYMGKLNHTKTRFTADKQRQRCWQRKDTRRQWIIGPWAYWRKSPYFVYPSDADG